MKPRLGEMGLVTGLATGLASVGALVASGVESRRAIEAVGPGNAVQVNHLANMSEHLWAYGQWGNRKHYAYNCLPCGHECTSRS